MHSELAAELDFDVADVARLIDPPGDRADTPAWARPSGSGAESWKRFGATGGSRETSLAPSLLRDRTGGEPETAPSAAARIDELAVSLNYTLRLLELVSQARRHAGLPDSG